MKTSVLVRLWIGTLVFFIRTFDYCCSLRYNNHRKIEGGADDEAKILPCT
jgi:hypothetical protein